MQQSWTDKKLALLKILWTEGKTAVAIAQCLGVSKSAVLGKIFRLRLAPPEQKPEPTAGSSPMLRRKGRRFAAESQDLATRRGKSLLELTNESCRWPIGDPAKKSFHFCRAPGATARIAFHLRCKQPCDGCFRLLLRDGCGHDRRGRRPSAAA
jgi:GcrA cell cycle regulator